MSHIRTEMPLVNILMYSRYPLSSLHFFLLVMVFYNLLTVGSNMVLSSLDVIDVKFKKAF